jgi:cytochrome c peroxidase
MTAAKVTLGRNLFFDERLSITGGYACATCHDPRRAFTDGLGRAIGATGDQHPRGAPSLVNVAYNASFGWADPELRRLEDQAAIPMLGEHPVELGLRGREPGVMAALLAAPSERTAFARAFPEASGHFTLLHVRYALAAYERTLIAAASPFDRYVFRDDRDALSETAQRGMQLFFSPRLGCSGCHPAPLFMSPATFEGHSAEPRFHNTGLYNVDGSGRYPEHNLGVFEHTRAPDDMGHFKVPTLRNIAETAPFMHDGSIATLQDVIRHYAVGGLNRPAPGSDARGPRGPFQSPELQAFELEPGDVEALVAFLESLSDENPAYAGDAAVRSR